MPSNNQRNNELEFYTNLWDSTVCFALILYMPVAKNGSLSKVTKWE